MKLFSRFHIYFIYNKGKTNLCICYICRIKEKQKEKRENKKEIYFIALHPYQHPQFEIDKKSLLFTSENLQFRFCLTIKIENAISKREICRRVNLTNPFQYICFASKKFELPFFSIETLKCIFCRKQINVRLRDCVHVRFFICIFYSKSCLNGIIC